MKNKVVYSGFPGDCSPEQLNILARFRQEVRNMGCSDPPYDDVYLLRFLRARKFDWAKTMEMWNNFINWRKSHNVDNVLDVKFPQIAEAKKYYPHGYFRTDKQGRPLYIERVGHLKYDGLTKVIPHDQLEIYFIQSYERLLNIIFPACSRAAGKRIDQTCYIIDLKGAGAKMMSPKMWEILKMASRIGSDFYPEVLGTMFIINTPLFFYGVWNIIKGFVDEKTRKKIRILGSGYQKELLETVGADNLPDFFGGKATVKDYGENLTNEQGPWSEEASNLKSKAQVIEQDLPIAQTPILYENEQSIVKPGPVIIGDLIFDENYWAFPDVPEEDSSIQEDATRTFDSNASTLVKGN